MQKMRAIMKRTIITVVGKDTVLAYTDHVGYQYAFFTSMADQAV